MSTINVLNMAGETVGTVELCDGIFGIEPNPVTDQEEHFFTYALYPHGGDWREGGTVQEAYRQIQSLSPYPCAEFSRAQDDGYVVPDVLLQEKDGVLSVAVNRAYTPELSVSRNSTSESGVCFSSSETFVMSRDPSGALPNRRVTTSCSLPEM